MHVVRTIRFGGLRLKSIGIPRIIVINCNIGEKTYTNMHVLTLEVRT